MFLSKILSASSHSSILGGPAPSSITGAMLLVHASLNGFDLYMFNAYNLYNFFVTVNMLLGYLGGGGEGGMEEAE